MEDIFLCRLQDKLCTNAFSGYEISLPIWFYFLDLSDWRHEIFGVLGFVPLGETSHAAAEGASTIDSTGRYAGTNTETRI